LHTALIVLWISIVQCEMYEINYIYIYIYIYIY
jgi:hypothetical protein